MIFHFILNYSNVFHFFRLTLKGFQPVTLILLKVTSKCFHCTSVMIILFLINTILHSICRFVKFYAKKKRNKNFETKRDKSFLFHFFVSYCHFLFSTFFYIACETIETCPSLFQFSLFSIKPKSQGAFMSSSVTTFFSTFCSTICP